jgi:hypothetical protein
LSKGESTSVIYDDSSQRLILVDPKLGLATKIMKVDMQTKGTFVYPSEATELLDLNEDQLLYYLFDSSDHLVAIKNLKTMEEVQIKVNKNVSQGIIYKDLIAIRAENVLKLVSSTTGDEVLHLDAVQGNIVIQGDQLYYSDKYAVKVLDINTLKSNRIASQPATSIAIDDDKLFIISNPKGVYQVTLKKKVVSKLFGNGFSELSDLSVTKGYISVYDKTFKNYKLVKMTP